MKFLIKFLSLFSEFFSKAGSIGHVFTLKNGRSKSKGIAWSGFVGPETTIAIVPTTSQIIDFAVKAKSIDEQDLTIIGNITVTLVPDTAVSKFDFTADLKTGQYIDNRWLNKVCAAGIQEVLAPIREKALALTIKEAVMKHADFVNALNTALAGGSSTLSSQGINFVSCSVSSVKADNEKVSEAIGSEKREEILTKFDQALHTRKMKSAKSVRDLKEYEAETAKNMEAKNAELIEEESKNKQSRASADAAVIKTLLTPYENVEGGKILGLAIMEAAKTGINTLSITPELVAAIKGQLDK